MKNKSRERKKGSEFCMENTLPSLPLAPACSVGIVVTALPRDDAAHSPFTATLETTG